MIGFECFVKIGDDIWFSEYNFNSLLRFNLKENKIYFIGFFPRENILQKRLYGSVQLCCKKLIFAPFYGKEIAIYNIEKRVFDKIKIKVEKNTYPEILATVCYGYKVFMFGNVVLKYDLQTGEIEYYNEIIDMISKNENVVKDNYFRSDIALNGNIMYIATCNCNLVIEFDMLYEKYEIWPVGDKTRRYSSIVCDGENFWLGSRVSGMISYYNKGENTLEEYFVDDRIIYGFSNLLMYGDFLYAFALGQKFCYRFDKNRSFYQTDFHTIANFKHSVAKLNNAKIYMCDSLSGVLAIYDIENRKENVYGLRYTLDKDILADVDEKEENIRKLWYNVNFYKQESYFCQLINYIDMIQDHKNEKDEAVCEKKMTVGKAVFKKVKK